MATNNLLRVAVDADDTTLEFTATNDFPESGVCQIGTEKIKYKVSTDRGVEQCIRGYASTSAASHSVSDAVTFVEDVMSAGNAVQLGNEVVMINGAGAPVDGTSGDGAGFAAIGSFYTRRDTGKVYVNGGTKASPAWKLVTSAA